MEHLQWLLQPRSLLKHALSLLWALLNEREYGCAEVNWLAGAGISLVEMEWCPVEGTFQY